MRNLLTEMSLYTGLREHEVQRIMLSAPVRYKTFLITKRNGTPREIAQPASEVKTIQKALMGMLLGRLPVHSCATAYIPGKSTLDNAAPHSNNGPILKLDFKNFFPSLKSTDWIAYCHRTRCLEDEGDIHLTSRLLFHRAKGHSTLRLAIGAPSSPMISNILMYEFDSLVLEAMSHQEVTYTRYADDMTFSAPRAGYLNDIVKKVGRIIRELDSPSLDLNREKTTYVTKKFHRSVTGLTLANDGRITIGRERKRKIRATVHRAVNGQLSPLEVQVLAGTLAYVNSVEPTFIEALRRHYGDVKIAELQKTKRNKKLAFHIPPVAPSELAAENAPPLRHADWVRRKRWP